jgi:hypothetical protein
VREVRDEIRRRVWKLIAKQGWWKLRPLESEEATG